MAELAGLVPVVSFVVINGNRPDNAGWSSTVIGNFFRGQLALRMKSQRVRAGNIKPDLLAGDKICGEYLFVFKNITLAVRENIESVFSPGFVGYFNGAVVERFGL